MRLLYTSFLLACSTPLLTSASPIIEKRDIQWPSHHTSMIGGLPEINSWTLAGLASTLIGSAPSPTHLAYLCDNWASLTTRYTTAFSTPAGDIVEQARSRVCRAVTHPYDPTLPISDQGGALFALRGYLSGTLTLQVYGNSPYNNTWNDYMCLYLEDRLLEGVWAWGEDRDTLVAYSNVDVEASLCSSAGWFTKGSNTQYTEGPVEMSVQIDAKKLVSEMLALVLRVVVDSDEKAVGVCDRLGEYEVGIARMGLNFRVIEKVLCGEKNVDVLEEAVTNLRSSMSRLFAWQVIYGGSWNQTGAPEYRQFLCENLVEEALQKRNLDGQLIKKLACDSILS